MDDIPDGQYALEAVHVPSGSSGQHLPLKEVRRDSIIVLEAPAAGVSEALMCRAHITRLSEEAVRDVTTSWLHPD